jgi:hypothetical protein
MSNLPIRGVTGAFCLLLATTAAFAQQYPQARGYATSPMAYQSAATVVGTYKSNDFFPSPLVLTITGSDASGNLSGSMWGMRTVPTPAGQEPGWERWQQVFGTEGMRATYRGGRVLIQFRSGAYYDLQLSGNELTGKYVASDENRSMTFTKSAGLAAR